MRRDRVWVALLLLVAFVLTLVLDGSSTAEASRGGGGGRRRRRAAEDDYDDEDEQEEDQGFMCDSGAKRIPHAWVNDDICDCKDGSDEPRTSACAGIKTKPTFKCANAGSLPINIFTSRVHDGICDCCDGSDEKEGVCRNRCEEERAEHALKAKEELRLVMEGRAKRNAAQVEAGRVQEAWAKELSAEKASKAALERLVLRLKLLQAKEEAKENSERFTWARGARRRALEEAIEAEKHEWDKDLPPHPTAAATIDGDKDDAKDNLQLAKPEGPVTKDGEAPVVMMAASSSEEGEDEEEGEEDGPGGGGDKSKTEAIRAQEKKLGVRPSSSTTSKDKKKKSKSKKKGQKAAAAEASFGGRDGLLRVMEVEVSVRNVTRKLRDYIEEEDRVASGTLKQPLSIEALRRERTLFAGMLGKGGGGWTELLETALQLTGAVVVSPVRLAAWGVTSSVRSLQATLLPPWLAKEEEEEEEEERAAAAEWFPSLSSVLPSSSFVRSLEWALEHMWDGPGLAYTYFFPDTVKGYERLEAALMRKAVAVAQEELIAQHRYILGLAKQKDQEGDWGPQQVFLTWRDRCFDASDKSQTHSYKVCPFKHVKQGDVLVGNWARWGARKTPSGGKKTAGAKGNEHNYMLFDKGQQCWQGPQRSAEVRLVCSPEEAIIEVAEPSMCVYNMVMTTPLACDDQAVQTAENNAREVGVEITSSSTDSDSTHAGEALGPPKLLIDEL